MSIGRERRGVTLPEVLVATVVMMLLLALLIPVALSVKASSEQTACASGARQNGMAVLLYTQDYDGVYPLHDQSKIREAPGKGQGGAVVDEWATTRVPNWSSGSAPYSTRRQILACASNRGWADNVDYQQPPLSFAFNGWASARPQTDAQTPNTLVMIYDVRYQASWSTANPTAALLRGAGRGSGGGRGGQSGTMQYVDVWNETNGPPHQVNGDQGTYNVVFLDGHCKSMGSEEFQSHARYKAHKPPKGLVPPIPENHFAF